MADGFPEMSPTPPRGQGGVTIPDAVSANVIINGLAPIASQAANAATLQALRSDVANGFRQIDDITAELRNMSMEQFILVQDAVTRTAYYATRGIQEAQQVDQHVVDVIIPRNIANAVAVETQARIEGVNNSREQAAALVQQETTARIEGINNTRDQVTAPYTASKPLQLPIILNLVDGMTVDYPTLSGAVDTLKTELQHLTVNFDQAAKVRAEEALIAVTGAAVIAPGVGHLVYQAVRTWIDFPHPDTVPQVMDSIGQRLNELDSQCTDLMNNGGRKLMQDHHDWTSAGLTAALLAFLGYAYREPVAAAADTVTVLEPYSALIGEFIDLIARA